MKIYIKKEKKTKVINTPSYILINDYEPGDYNSLEYNLDVYDRASFTHNFLFHYNEKEKELRIPKIYSKAKLNYIFNTNALNAQNNYTKPDKLGIMLKCPPRDESQEDIINFILSQGKYRGLDKYKRRLAEVDTGVGKTYCIIASITLLKQKAGIIIPTNALIEQWSESFQKFTNISEKEIFVVSGSSSIKKILRGKCDKYKIFLISHRTISNYANKHSWYEIEQMFNALHIGIKIFDEAHKEMKNTVFIDLFSNVNNTVYLTATAERSQFNENKVYNSIFCTVPTLTIQRTKEESYVTGVVFRYDSKPSILEIETTRSIRGMNLIRYMDYQLFGRGRKYVNKILNICIKSFLPKGGKMIILVLKRDGAKDIQSYLEETYPELKGDVGLFTSDVNKEDKKEQLKKRVIITTTKSFGFGIDLPNLRYVINCEPYSSKITLQQCLGRLRKIDNVLQCYVELVDNGFNQRKSQFKIISPKLLSLTNSCKIYEI